MVIDTMARRVAALLVATLLAGCGAGTTNPAPPTPEGPLDKGVQHAWATKAEVGDTFTDGMEVLAFHGRRTALIRSIELVGDAGLELVGVKLAGPRRSIGSIQYIEGWPPRDPELDRSSLMPAYGRALKPSGKATYQLLLGIRVTERGYLVRRGIKVEYTTDDGSEYTQFLPAILAVCSSRDWLARKRECPLPKGWFDFPESLADRS